MENDTLKNKRVFLEPFMGLVKQTQGAPIPLPPADKGTTGGKGPGQDGWESVDGVVEGPVQAIAVNTRIKMLRGSTKMIGRISKPLNRDGFYQVQWDNNSAFWLVRPTEIEVIDKFEKCTYNVCRPCGGWEKGANAGCKCTCHKDRSNHRELIGELGNDMNNEGPMTPMQEALKWTKEQMDSAKKRRVPRRVAAGPDAINYGTGWPDSGIAMPSQPPRKNGVDINPLSSSNFIFPQEILEPTKPKKIHEFGLDEDFERTSIDDDMNDYGGLGRQLAEALEAISADSEDVDRDEIGDNVETEDNKYGPGNYPSEDDYRTEGFYENLFNEPKAQFTWMIPGILAGGPHPIYTSHQEDLSALKKAGFKAIVSLLERPLEPKYVEGFQYLHIPTADGYINDLRIICRFIDAQEVLGNPVFIHCFAGKGRSGTALAAYLLYKKYLTGAEEAIAYVRQHYHKDAIESTYQESALFKFVLED